MQKHVDEKAYSAPKCPKFYTERGTATTRGSRAKKTKAGGSRNIT